MIARVWTGTTRPGCRAAYLAHLRQSVLPELSRIEGFAGADVLCGVDRADEVIVMTRWTSIDAVRRFSGADATKAVIAPAAAPLLARHDDRAVHYEILEHV